MCRLRQRDTGRPGIEPGTVSAFLRHRLAGAPAYGFSHGSCSAAIPFPPRPEREALDGDRGFFRSGDGHLCCGLGLLAHLRPEL
jgi:hypothetical protein